MAISGKTPHPASLDIRTAKPSSVRAVNRSIMLELIRQHQPVSRADLARLTGVFRSSVSDIIDGLIQEGLVTEERNASYGRRGRTPMSLCLNDGAYPVLGLNIRPRYFQLAYAGLSGRIQKSLRFETPGSPKELVETLSAGVKQMRKELGWSESQNFQRIGVAIPGHVDTINGRIVWVPTHTELNDFPMTDCLEQQTGITTLADNDCNLGALSELWLTTERRRKDRSADFVFLNVSDFGTGAGAVVNGEIYRGHDGRFAAEVGHMIVEPAGLLCNCGRRGCWEMYVSNEATWRRVHPRLSFTSEHFTEMLNAASQGDSKSVAALNETADYLSLGISNIGFVFNPSEIVLAGRITAVWDLIRSRVANGYGSPRLTFSVHPAHLSADDSLLHGAVCLALREIFAGPKFGQN